jgi:hypothetical protein
LAGFVKSAYSQLRSSRLRSLLRLTACSLIALWPLAAFASTKTKAQAAASPDVPSGFLPGIINYFAGNAISGGTYTDGSIPTNVSIGTSYAVADSQGNIYIASTTGAIYIVFAGGAVPAALANVTTNAPTPVTPEAGRIYQVAGLIGLCQGPGDPTLCGEGLPLNQVLFGSINGLAIDASDNIYYSDEVNTQVVRRIDGKTTIVTTVAGQLGGGTPTGGNDAIGDGGPATGATLSYPTDVQVDSFGNLFISDTVNQVVRVVYSGSQPPPILAAEGIATDPSQKGFIFSVAGQVGTFCSTTPTSGSPGSPGGCGDYGPATSGAGLITLLSGFSLDSSGNIYIPDSDPFVSLTAYLRLVYAGGTVPPLLNLALNPGGGNSVSPTPGYIYAVTGYGLNPQFAGCSLTPCGDGGMAANMQLGTNASNATSGYYSSTLDAEGDFYIVDPYDFAVRKIDSSGYASTVAGIDDPNQKPPPSVPPPAGGAATSTQLINPFSIAFDHQNNLYIADSNLEWQVQPLLPQTIDFPAFSPATVLYGVNPITLNATSSSGLPLTYSVTGPGTLNGSQLVITSAGPNSTSATITVTASQNGNAQYAAATPVSQTLTVDPAPATVTANNASKTLGSQNPAFSATVSDSQSNLLTTPSDYSGTPAFTTTAVTNSPIGTYPIDVAVGSLNSSKYVFSTFVPGTLTITGNTPQTITFAPLPPVTYGQTKTLNLTATASSGLPVNFQVLSGPGTIASGSSTLTITGGGTIVINATQQGGGTYQAAQAVQRSLVVNPATLTVTGPAVSLAYGAPINPSSFPTATITGFVNGDSQAAVLTGSAQLTTVSGNPNVGTYPINVAMGSITLLPAYTASYTLATANGTLTITQASQTVAFNPVPASQTYGNQPFLTAGASSGLPVTFTTTGPAIFLNGNTTPGISTPVQATFNGVGSATIIATQTGNNNYMAAPPVTQTFTVAQAPLNIFAKPLTIEQGAPIPDLTNNYTIGAAPGTTGGFLLGDTDVPRVITGLPAITTTATQSSSAGQYPIVPSQGSLSAANYYFVFQNSTLTILPPGSINITASPSSLNISSGLSAQSTLTLTPINVYQGTVTLSCGQVPTNVSCVVSPSTYVFPGSQNADGSENPAQGTVTITASGAPVIGAVHGEDSAIRAASFFLIPGALAGLLVAFSRRRVARVRGMLWGIITFLVLGISMAGIASCGGSSNMINAAKGTSTIMITGTGTTASGVGTVTATVPLQVTIQ